MTRVVEGEPLPVQSMDSSPVVAPHADRPRVLIVGDREEVALVACRFLGKAGYEVGATGSGGSDAVRVSRHVERYHVLPPPHDSLERWQAGLRQVIARHGYDVAVATSDSVLSGWRDMDLGIPTCPRLEPRHRSLTDKHRLADLAAEADIRYPRTRAPRSPEEDEAHALGVVGPTVIKAARPAGTSGVSVPHLPRPKIVEDAAAALDALTEIRRSGAEPLLQDHLAGPKLQAIIIRRDGRTSCRLAFRVMREYPAGGAEAMLLAIEAGDGPGGEMVSMLERLVDRAGYEGILGAEFIQQAGTNDLYLLDPNPRLWGSLAFAELLGFRMTERVVLDAIGRPAPPPPPEVSGRRYHHPFRELKWLAHRRRVPGGYVATFSRRDVWSLPWMSDPLPDVRRIVSAARRRLPLP